MVIRGGKVARIMVQRGAACTGDCEGCGFCAEGRSLYVDAYNPARAEEGQTVIVETATNIVMTAAVLVYLLPLVVFLTAYFAMQAFGAENTWSVICALAGCAASFLVARYYNKKCLDKPSCTIVDVKENRGLK